MESIIERAMDNRALVPISYKRKGESCYQTVPREQVFSKLEGLRADPEVSKITMGRPEE